jgi:hypothetical protein
MWLAARFRINYHIFLLSFFFFLSDTSLSKQKNYNIGSSLHSYSFFNPSHMFSPLDPQSVAHVWSHLLICDTKPIFFLFDSAYFVLTSAAPPLHSELPVLITLSPPDLNFVVDVVYAIGGHVGYLEVRVTRACTQDTTCAPCFCLCICDRWYVHRRSEIV